jgi:hypothetical protein
MLKPWSPKSVVNAVACKEKPSEIQHGVAVSAKGQARLVASLQAQAGRPQVASAGNPAELEWIEKHRSALALLPADLAPSSKHGQWSFTCSAPTSEARVEVLLKHRCYYIKSAASDGRLPDGSPRVRWDLKGSPMATWDWLKPIIKW